MSFIKRAKDNYFVINGRPSTDWGITISCDSAFNGAERDIEAITIPGRDGDLLMDKGRFKNIAVTYNDCLIESDFTAEFDSFRAYISSLRGYVRLEDTFHPEEYRMAYLGEGIKVDRLGTRYHSGVFDVTFTCMPQRFKKAGEESVAVPCSPAASPATARRYWRLSAFPEDTREILSLGLKDIGYTQAEIDAMQFTFIKLFDSPSAWPAGTVAPVNILEFKGYDSNRFFAFSFAYDPTKAGESGGYVVLKQPLIGQLSPYFVNDYYIVPKTVGGEILYANRKIGQDETYQFGTVVNPTRFHALPRMTVTLPSSMSGLSGNTVYLAGIGQNGVAIKWTESLEHYTGSKVTIDAELMDVFILPQNNTYGGTFVNINPYAKFFGGRIELAAGDNTIRLDPMVAGCEIIPRWWEI